MERIWKFWLFGFFCLFCFYLLIPRKRSSARRRQCRYRTTRPRNPGHLFFAKTDRTKKNTDEKRTDEKNTATLTHKAVFFSVGGKKRRPNASEKSAYALLRFLLWFVLKNNNNKKQSQPQTATANRNRKPQPQTAANVIEWKKNQWTADEKKSFSKVELLFFANF